MTLTKEKGQRHETVLLILLMNTLIDFSQGKRALEWRI